MTAKVALATSNEGKRAELAPLFEELDIELVLPDARLMSEIEESGLTFIENALIKARAVSAITQLPAIADDSGLSVNALDGKPGIHSARYAGTPSDALRNNEKLLATMSDVPDREREASFQCVLVYLRHPDDPVPLIGIGSWEGEILRAPRGSQGFGYDPLFFLPSLNRTAAELTTEEKNAISHRAKAAKQLVAKLHGS
ncbi:MAG: RdgB/HAM1 family non-canonical purine NTP pyrophosphatase [Gammaproteobacteria bacterium]|nr:RdgB/HAM1 family non-canonical purine NTP pyrophosphatase [Gammaproteobacteria bacterium]